MHRYVAGFERTMTRKEVRDVDAWAINKAGIPGIVLMENAGRSCAELAMELLKGVKAPKVIIFCGAGNNGGDGYVIARHLHGLCETTVCLCGQADKVKGDARTNLDILKAMGQAVVVLEPSSPDLRATVSNVSAGRDLVVDAVFGTGLSENMRPEYVALIEAMNNLGGKKLAIDIPSGLDCDTGRPMPVAFAADATVTFVAAKQGFSVDGSSRYTGHVYVASIGIEPHN
jgi:NAD(P)H-hydrate epimerase